MRGMGRHLIPVHLAVLALAIIWITPASCKADGSFYVGRDSTNWYSYPFYDMEGKFNNAHNMFRLFRSNNMRYPDLGPSGQSYHSFKNPVLVNSGTSRVLAFAQGHKYDNRDCGHVTIVLRRPKDPRSETWQFMVTYPVWWKAVQEPFEGYEGTWTNPTPVVDGKTIYLFANWNRLDYSRHGNETLPTTGQVMKKIDSTPEGRRRIFMSKSFDDGKTWLPPEDMTEQLTPKGWSWDVVGRGRGIKARTGELVVPAMGRNFIGRGPPGNRTWLYQSLEGSGEEGTIVQTSSDLLFRSDSANPGDGYRRVSRGTVADGFSPFTLDKNMPDPGLGGGGCLILYSYRNWTLSYPHHNRILFINSHSSTNKDELRIQISYYHDASRFDVWRDLGDHWLYTEWDCRRITGREGGRASMTWIQGGFWNYVATASELSFGENGGSKDDHFAILFRHMHISWIIHGQINGYMHSGPEETDPAKRIDPDGLRDYPDPEDDPRPYARPLQRHFQTWERGRYVGDFAGNDCQAHI
ncbi:hypothetical protein C2857_000482 [Epichloe festucae Fl1]|uniref:Sialidase domain-containing protein n=1 Tax=Epichloe festucae (strain Fl1) TaxID=877507 RepID=A0A7S9KV75_EPIFF|nr:hypothetical protein C2857_000482 [Epichloe festucae Fl1]